MFERPDAPIDTSDRRAAAPRRRRQLGHRSANLHDVRSGAEGPRIVAGEGTAQDAAHQHRRCERRRAATGRVRSQRYRSRPFLFLRPNDQTLERDHDGPAATGQTSTLATVKAITYTAADGTIFPAYLTLPPGSDGKNLPTIVYAAWWPGARDEWGFDWLPQFFAARGYRGHPAQFPRLERLWRRLVQQERLSDRGAPRSATSTMRGAGWSSRASPTRRSWRSSAGRMAAMRRCSRSVRRSDLFKAVVAIAPVTDLETLTRRARGTSSNCRNSTRYSATARASPRGSPARNAAKIKAPVLLFHGDRDQNVGIGESRLMATR